MAFFVVRAQDPIFEENFENAQFAPNGIGSLPSDWTLHNQDSLTPVNDGNFNQLLTQAWNVVDFTDIGRVAVSSSLLEDDGQADRWMVTPQINLPNEEAYLTFKTLAYNDQQLDEYEVLVSTTGPEVEDFTDAPILTEVVSAGNDFNWKKVSLEDYAGEDVYIAFRNISDNGHVLILGEIMVSVLENYDVQLKDLVVERYNAPGEDIEIEVTLRNVGINTVSSVDIEWTDGEDIYTEEYTDLNLTTLEHTELNLSTALNYSSSGQREITITAMDVNGNVDDNPENNEVSGFIFVYNDGAEQKVVIEEGTGTWCGWCPRGFVAMDYMYDNPDQFPNFIGIGVHNGDPMAVQEYDSGLGLTGFPGSHINRVLKEIEVGITNWAGAYAQLKDNIKPFELSLEVDYDKSERFATINVNTEFFMDIENTEFKISVVVIEDGVTGTGAGWGQTNYYAGGTAGPMDGWENLPGTVTDFEYDRVARALIGGFNGESGSIPTEVSEGDIHSYEFTYTHPEGMNPQKMSFVALLIDQETGEILNAAEEPIPYELGLDKNIVDNFKLYPNPASDVVNATFNETINGEVEMNIYNLNGKVVKTQNFKEVKAGEEISVNVDHLATGEYLISFATAKGSMVKHLIVK